MRRSSRTRCSRSFHPLSSWPARRYPWGCIKIRIKTVPLKQWEVGHELRRSIKKAFDARRIEIPFPHVSVYFGETSQPFGFRQAS